MAETPLTPEQARQQKVTAIEHGVMEYLSLNFKGEQIDNAIIGLVSATVRLVKQGTQDDSTPNACTKLLELLTQIRETETKHGSRIIVPG